jgi:16S rRNA (cytosine967-C5)-methyltransferase
VDLRYRLKPADIPELASKARRLLANAARLTRAGGRLVYSTCTLTREENEQTVGAFLGTCGGAWELSGEKVFPPWLGDEVGVEAVTPSDSDASYCALLIRKK